MQLRLRPFPADLAGGAWPGSGLERRPAGQLHLASPYPLTHLSHAHHRRPSPWHLRPDNTTHGRSDRLPIPDLHSPAPCAPPAARARVPGGTMLCINIQGTLAIVPWWLTMHGTQTK